MHLPAIGDPKRRSRILHGLARNPSAPADVVRRLIDLPGTAREVAWRRADLTDDLVEAILASGDPGVVEYLGHNDRIPTRVRRPLAAHPDPAVRASAARHTLPENIVPGCEVPAALLERLAGDPHPTVRQRVAEHDNTPDHARTALAADPEPAVRRTVAQWWQRAPVPVRRALLTDPDPSVRAAAISPWHPPPAPDLHPALLADPATRAAVIPHVELTAKLAAELAASPHEQVRQALAGHPDLPAPTRDLLATDPDVIVRVRLVENRTTPEHTRVQLLASLDAEQDRAERWIIDYFLGNAWRDKTSLGWLWDAPLEERLRYLDSPHYFFRRAVALSRGLPQHAVDRLLADPDIETRRIIARHYNVPGEVLEQIVGDHGETRHILPLLVDRPNFPRAAFARFTTSHLARLRHLACHDRDLAPELVARLAADTEASVRRAVADHPHLPARCLPSLLADDDLDVAEAAGAAPVMPVAWMRQLLTDAGA